MKRLRHYTKGTAIVLSCFGSVVEQGRYQELQEKVQARYPQCTVRVAVSSRMVIKKLAAKGEQHQHLPSVLASLDMEGYQRILVVSCYLFPTDEHKQVEMIVEGFKNFSLSAIDYTPAIIHHTHRANDLLSTLNSRFQSGSDINLFVHHGAPYLDNPGHQAISYCDTLLSQLSPKNISCSLEGAMPFDLLQTTIKGKFEGDTKPVLRIIPLLLVSGNHFVKDMVEIMLSYLNSAMFR
ncbi:sirohydrochlorin cobaltochelatase [Vibrio hannami]|uniref:sirohydrochlorin cobaltochelatase n=1 Tax=Vibrio hannami TaxID=2717094 RepID=UPI002410697A|nr:sirohydrochlorin cobaltochelatase [Vibrio hannami]MDG3085155.1 sirohydrochlorin cobaltochelatase [Vibrio hannami]